MMFSSLYRLFFFKLVELRIILNKHLTYYGTLAVSVPKTWFM